MNFIILTRTSIRAIYKHKARSLLTILGIMIGIAAIIVTFSIGSGAETKIRDQILSMGERAIYIIPGNIIERGRARSNLADAQHLTIQDLEAIDKQVEGVDYISRGNESISLMKNNGNSIKERVIGTDANMLNIANYKLKYGTFFNDFHVQHRVNVVVIGKELAQKLFKHRDPIGKTINIENIPFTVIGVLDHIDVFFGTNDPNVRAYIPFTVSDKYFRRSDYSTGDVSFIALKTNPKLASSGQALRQVKRVLRFTHNINEDESDDFTIFDQETIAQSAQQASRIIKLFGLLAAAIALIVGGIGVMNIMLVSVQERTKEIGIRLALGATQWMVQLQFLIESVTLCTLGGIIGVIIGTTLQFLLSILTNLPGHVALLPLLVSFFITIIIGIFFGYYPARKASLLNPADALIEK